MLKVKLYETLKANRRYIDKLVLHEVATGPQPPRASTQGDSVNIDASLCLGACACAHYIHSASAGRSYVCDLLDAIRMIHLLFQDFYIHYKNNN